MTRVGAGTYIGTDEMGFPIGLVCGIGEGTLGVTVGNAFTGL